jgi:nitrogen fixation NifU-like protein
MELHDLYQELIIDHGTKPRNYKKIEHTHSAKGYNPLCGDQIEIFIKIEDNLINDIAFTGKGCAISQASASILTEMLKDKPIAEAKNIFTNFCELLEISPVEANLQSANLNLVKLEALAGVKNYPSRIKCATLAWHAMQRAINSTN